MASIIITIETNKATSKRVLNNILASLHSGIHEGIMRPGINTFSIAGSTFGVNYKAEIELDTESVNQKLD